MLAILKMIRVPVAPVLRLNQRLRIFLANCLGVSFDRVETALPLIPTYLGDCFELH